MYTGTISALDPDHGFGLIDADDGAIVLLHPDSPRREFEMLSLRVGQRVIFSVERDAIGDHAVSLAPERRV
jgi:cold shock CspA family protein